MTNWNIETAFIKDVDFALSNPINATITDVKTEKNKWGNADCVVWFKLDSTNEIRKTSAYLESRNALIKAYGQDDTLWIGKRIQIERTSIIDKTTQKEKILTTIKGL